MLRFKEILKAVSGVVLLMILFLNQLAAQSNDPYIRSFTAEYEKNRGLILHWSSKFNDTTSYFIIERSIDGQNFEEVGTLTPLNTQTSFKFIDRKPYSDVSYYRLQVVDYDGKVFYSNLISHFIPTYGKPELVLYPMPVGNANTLNLSFQGIEKDFKAVVTITDHFGRQVLSKEIDISSINSRSSLELSGILAAGNYQMTVLGHSGQSFKIGKLLQIVE